MFFLNQETVQILDNTLMFPCLGQILHLLQHFLQIFSRIDGDLLHGKHSVIKLVLHFEHFTKVTLADDLDDVECFTETVQSYGSILAWRRS